MSKIESYLLIIMRNFKACERVPSVTKKLPLESINVFFVGDFYQILPIIILF